MIITLTATVIAVAVSFICMIPYLSLILHQVIFHSPDLYGYAESHNHPIFTIVDHTLISDFCQRIGIESFFNLFIGNMGIDLRCSQIGMSKDSLQSSDIYPTLLIHQGRCGVPEFMR